MKYITILLLAILMVPGALAFTAQEESVIDKISTQLNFTSTEKIVLKELLNFTDTNTISNESAEVQQLEDDLNDLKDDFEKINFDDLNESIAIDDLFKKYNNIIDQLNESEDESRNNRYEQVEQQRKLLQEYYDCRREEAYSAIKLCDSIYPEFSSLNLNQEKEEEKSTAVNTSEFYTKNQIDSNFIKEDDFPEIPDVNPGDYAAKEWVLVLIILIAGLAILGFYREKELQKKIDNLRARPQPVSDEDFEVENGPKQN